MAVINILGEICHWNYDCNPKNIIQDILDVPKGETIHVNINSPGGEVFGSIGIITVLMEHDGEVVTKILGLAASAAAGIAVGGSSKIIMSPHAYIMIHKASTLVYGTAKELRAEADEMDAIDKTISNIYKARLKLSDTEIGALLEQETWYTAKEAVKAGMADEILEKRPEQNIQNFSAYFRSKNKYTSKQIDTDEIHIKELKAMIDNMVSDLSITHI